MTEIIELVDKYIKTLWLLFHILENLEERVNVKQRHGKNLKDPTEQMKTTMTTIKNS